MRLGVLNTGYGFGTKALFKVIETFSREPMPDAAKVTFYRPDFYGAPMKQLTHEAMRGESAWSVGERELMAAYVSSLNQCRFCIGAHSATATMAFRDQSLVSAVLADLETAPIEEPLRATLWMLGKQPIPVGRVRPSPYPGSALPAGSAPPVRRVRPSPLPVILQKR